MKINKHLTYTGLILALGLVVRIIGINQSFWLDEAAQAIESSRPWYRQFDIIPDFQPPLFHLWVHLFTYFNHQEWWLRLASLIPGIATLYITMQIASNLFNRKIAVISGLLLSISQLHLFYSQELRPYSLATFWATLNTFSFIKLLTSQTNSSTSKYKILYVLTLIAGIYTLYTFPFLLVGQVIVLMLQKPTQYKFFPLAFAIALLAYIPWLPTFWLQFQAGTNLAQQSPAWANAVSLPLFKALPLTFAQFLIGRIPIDLTFISLIPLVIIISIILLIIPISLRSIPVKKLLILSITPIISAFVVSIFVPVLDPKRVLFCLPLILIIIAHGLAAHPAKKILLTCFVLVNLFSVGRYYVSPTLQREPWKQAINHIEDSVNHSTPVIFAFPEPFAPWLWYQSANLPATSFSGVNIQDADALEQKLKPFRLKSELIVFEYLMDISDPRRIIQNWIIEAGFRPQSIWQYPGIGKIYLYSKQADLAIKP